VVGDDDGLVVLTDGEAAAAIDGAEEIERAERALLDRMAAGDDLHGLTTLDEHLAALAAGRSSRLGFRV
jgi:regulator of RNase E activity RraA